MSPDLAIPASPAALRNEGSGFLPLTAKAASFSGIGYASGSGVTLCMGQFQGGFALCTVTGTEILDQDLHRIAELVIDQPRNVYVRQSDVSQSGNTFLVDFSTEEEDGTAVDSVKDVVMTRLGKSATFISEPIRIEPQPGLVELAAPGGKRAVAETTKKANAPRKPKGKARALRFQETMATCLLGPGLVVEFFVDTTFNGKSFHQDGSGRNPAGGQQPNILLADESSVTQVSAWLHVYTPGILDTAGVPNVPLAAKVANLANGGLLGAGGSTVTSASAITDASGWAQFTFRAAPLSAAADGRVANAEISIFDPQDPSQASIAKSTSVYSYGAYDFRSLPITNADLFSPGITAGRIQTIFESYSSHGSFLANLFFKGNDAFIDSAHRCQPGSTTCDFDPVLDTEWYSAGVCPACDLFAPNLTPVPAAQRFFEIAESQGINAWILLAVAEREKSLLTVGSMPSSKTLDWAMGVGTAGGKFVAQIEAAAELFNVWLGETTYPPVQSAPVPPDGPFFFPSRDVPIMDLPVGTTKMVGYRMGQCSFSDRAIDRYNVAFMIPNRANYVIWRYNSWIQACTEPQGGGNRLLRWIANKLHALP